MPSTGNPRLAWDSYRRLIQGYAEGVASLPTAPFDALVAEALNPADVEVERELDHRDLHALAAKLPDVYQSVSKSGFPSDPREQLATAAAAAFRSWCAPKAEAYRRLNGFSNEAGTAATLKIMVYGDVGGTSGASLLYLPPYSPDINPIEKMFSKLKALLRKAAQRTVDGLWQAIADCIPLVTPRECAAYFEAAGYEPT